MNEIMITGTQEFLGKTIPIIEGGFGENQKVVLAKTIADIHDMELKEVNRLIKDNINEFEEGIDILDLKNCGDYYPPQLENLGFTKMQISKAKNIYLLSEQGYMAIVSLMRTDKAKELRKQFRREYFLMREVINNNLKDKLLLQLFSNDPLEVATAHKQLVEMETAPLIDTIEKQTPKVQVYDDFIDKEHTLGFRELRKELESTLNIVIKENKLKEVMKSLNLIGKTVKATAYAIRNEYAVTKDISHKNGTATQDRFTMKARDLILETIRGDINEIC